MKYYTCLPIKCLEVLKQLQIDLTLLEQFQDTLKQINVIKFFPSAINNATRFREILLRYLVYFAEEWRIYKVIKDQIHGGHQRVAFVLLQQLNAEAENEFVRMAENYKHLNLENDQTTLKQSVKKSIRVQSNSVYQSQRLIPKQNNQNNQMNNYMQQNQMNQQLQFNQFYQQNQMNQNQQSNEINQMKQYIAKLEQENKEEKEKRKLLQQQTNEYSKQLLQIQTENNQLKQQLTEQKSKEKSSRSKEDKKKKEIENENMKLTKEIEDLKNENNLLKKQIDSQKIKY